MASGSWVSLPLGNLGSLTTLRYTYVANDGSALFDILKADDFTTLASDFQFEEGTDQIFNLNPYIGELSSYEHRIKVKMYWPGSGNSPEISSLLPEYKKYLLTSTNIASDIQLASMNRIRIISSGSYLSNLIFRGTTNGLNFTDLVHTAQETLTSNLGSDVRYQIEDTTPRFGDIEFGSVAFSTGSPILQSSIVTFKSDDYD